MKKSITVIDKKVQYVYVIKDINIDQVTMEKFNVDCRENIEDAWGLISSHSYDQSSFLDNNNKTFEIILKDKVGNVTLTAKPDVIEIVAKLGGKIIKDFNVEKVKRGKRIYLTGIEFFNEPIEE